MNARTAIGTHRHLATLQTPGTPVPDGDGGYTTGWTYLSPSTWHCAIEPATARDLERVAAGTVIATATHVISGRYHPGITTATRLVFRGRVFQLTGVSNPEERNIMTICIAVELLGAAVVLEIDLGQAGLFQDGLVQEGFV